MTVLWAVVLLLTVVCTLDLILTLGVVRQLREHGIRLSSLQGGDDSYELAIRSPGGSVGEFSATSVTGASISNEDLTEPTLLGFFSPDCPSCADELPKYAAYARAFPGGPARVLAIVAGTPAGGEYETALSGKAMVLVEPLLGPMQQAFDVAGFPAFAIAVDGMVVQAAHEVDRLPEHQPA